MKCVFAPFSFDTVSGELRRDGRRIPLLGTASELLRVASAVKRERRPGE